MIKFNLIKNWADKKIIFLCFGFILLILFSLYPFPGLAGIVESFISAVTYIPYALIGVLFGLAVVLTLAFAWLMGGILDIVMSPSFINLSYTNPAGNQVIKLGLNITQSFVNLLLVVALVYTALSLALRMNETEAKRVLVRLIIVALLVNFAPVLCGLIVDGTNIVMYYFLEPMKEGVSGILTQVSTYKDVLLASLKKVHTGLSERLGVLMMAVTQIMVNISMGIVFFLYAVIFLMRYIVIWILVILAPLAFAGWVFPKEKPPGAWEFLDWILFPLRLFRGIWDKWIEQFIEWSIIGIPLAFFLYLAMGSFTLMSAVFKQKMTMPGIEEEAVGFFGNLFPFFVVIIFLFLGFTMGLETGARGGAAVIKNTKTLGSWLARKTGRETRRIARQALSRVTRGREEAWRKWAERQGAVRITEALGRRGIGRVLSIGGMAFGVTPIVWALRRGIGEAALRLKETEEREVKAAEKKYEGTNIERKAIAIYNRTLPVTQRIGILRQVIEEEQIGDLREFFRRKGLTDVQINQEFIRLGREALRIHPDVFNKIRDTFPHLAEEMGRVFAEAIRRDAGLMFRDPAEAGQFNNSIAARIISRIRPDKIPKMDWEAAFENPAIEESVHRFWAPEQLSSALRKFGRTFAERFQSIAERLGPDWYQINNPSLGRYLRTFAARSLGVGFPEVETPR